MMTVIMKPSPKARAMSLRRFFSMATFRRGPVGDARSSEVTRSRMAITASQRLMSEKFRGRFIFVPLRGCR